MIRQKCRRQKRKLRQSGHTVAAYDSLEDFRRLQPACDIWPASWSGAATGFRKSSPVEAESFPRLDHRGRFCYVGPILKRSVRYVLDDWCKGFLCELFY